MSTSRLQIYNGALLLLGERALASLTEAQETRRLLDKVWDDDGLRACLEEGQWYFAMRAVRIDYDITNDPAFGYQYAFEKPSDWVITSAVCQDEYFNAPLLQYVDEPDYWYCDLQELYVRYISDDAGYGLNLARWPRKFTEFVEAHFAFKICNKINGDRIEEMMDYREKMLTQAKNNNLMAGPTTFSAPGSWTGARRRWGSRRDRGNRGSLIG